MTKKLSLFTVLTVIILSLAACTVSSSNDDLDLLDDNKTVFENGTGKESQTVKVSEETKPDQTKKPEETKIEYQFTEEGIIVPEQAEMIIKDTAEVVIKAISEKDMATLAEFVHPEKGVRFTPYTYVSPERDIVFNKNQIENFFQDENTYLWGFYDGIGDEINLTPTEYFDEFVYTSDFINAEEVGYNTVLSFGNALENQFEVYENPIIVEYYFPGFNPEYAGMDWQSLRLVFEEYEGKWYLTGIIHNQWTI